MYILSLLRSETSIFQSLSLTLPSPIHTPALHHLHFSRSQGGCSMMQQHKEKEKEPQYEKVRKTERERERWGGRERSRGVRGGGVREGNRWRGRASFFYISKAEIYDSCLHLHHKSLPFNCTTQRRMSCSKLKYRGLSEHWAAAAASVSFISMFF